jgi:hypothetical protein
MLAVGLAAAGGVLAFQSLTANSGTFTGTISGGGVSSAATGTTIDADTDIGPRGVIAQAGSGEIAFRATHAGAIWDFGPSTGDDQCAYGNATSSGSASVECGTFTFSQANIGQISPRGALQYVPVVAGMGLKWFGFNLGTCNSSSERSVVVPGDSGGTTGHRTRICICASDGAATPTYYWVNTSGAVGTSTTCPFLEP